MGVKVEWSTAFWEGWTTRYPEFASLSEALAQSYFEEAGLYHANDGTGPVTDETQQKLLMYLVMAHIALRYATINGVGPTPLVGVLNHASEGSVSVGTQLNASPGSMQWWVQTKYGFDYWAATAQFRTMRYRAGPQRYFGPIYPTGPGGWRWT